MMSDKGEISTGTLVIEPATNGGFIVRDQPADYGRMSARFLAFSNRADLLLFLNEEYAPVASPTDSENAK